MNKRLLAIGISMLLAFPMYAQKQWTLRECIEYAMQNNIQLKQNKLQKESSTEDLKQSRAQLLPSVNFSTGQNLSYRPFPNHSETTVTNGIVDYCCPLKLFR